MKDLKEALINKNTIKHIKSNQHNEYMITKDDLIDDISGFPIGVVVRMLEEQEKQGNKPDVKVFQRSRIGGFSWRDTEDGLRFWSSIITDREFDTFYKKYPNYKKYDI